MAPAKPGIDFNAFSEAIAEYCKSHQIDKAPEKLPPAVWMFLVKKLKPGYLNCSKIVKKNAVGRFRSFWKMHRVELEAVLWPCCNVSFDNFNDQDVLSDNDKCEMEEQNSTHPDEESKHSKDERITEMDVIMNKMKRMEEGYKEKLKDAEKSSELRIREFESVIKRLEKKYQRAVENFTKASDFNRSLSEKLASIAKESDKMLCEIEFSECL